MDVTSYYQIYQLVNSSFIETWYKKKREIKWGYRKPKECKPCKTIDNTFFNYQEKIKTTFEKQERFEALLKEWKGQTRYLSSINAIISNPAYLRIIGMGKEAVPMILNKLQKDPDLFFWALSAITGEDPVNPENTGNIPLMTEAWLQWGKRNGFIQ